MRRSTERLLTTHTGSLPRPEGIPLPGTDAAHQGATATDEQVKAAVREMVGRQVDAGLDVVNDGEVSKPSYSTYVTQRLQGFEERASETRACRSRRNSLNTSPGCPINFKGR